MKSIKWVKHQIYISKRSTKKKKWKIPNENENKFKKKNFLFQKKKSFKNKITKKNCTKKKK
jgi:hypothetical protein